MKGRSSLRGGALVVALAILAEPVVAHTIGLSSSYGTGGSVPTWLTIMTGGVVIGASFLFTSLLTDHGAVRDVTAWGLSLPTSPSVSVAVLWVVRLCSIAILALIVVTGLTGPATPTRNFAILAVWAGWWAGYTMTVYLVGNTWPAVNPWRALASLFPRFGPVSYPDRLGAWPSVIGLLALVWIEVISPVADDAHLLVSLILGYTVVTLAGALVVGTDPWFTYVDPIARVFRYYGRLAPIQRTETGIQFKMPSSALVEHPVSDEPGTTAFIIALLWVTTYDGFVSTPAWASIIRPLVSLGLPPLLVYFITIVGGFALFFAAYKGAAAKVRDTANTYVSTDFLERWFAPSLIPIGAGYHLAHFLGYFLSLSLALAAVVMNPFNPPAEVLLVVIPDWFGTLQLLLILLGHVIAVWVAHALSIDVFPGILKPIRSQYPFVVVMIFYTMSSMWIILQPASSPPYV